MPSSVRILLTGNTPEGNLIQNLGRKGRIQPTMYYKWSKAFLVAGKRQLNGDTIREASSNEVKEIRDENNELKMLVAELSLRTRVLKKTLKGLEYASIDT